GVSDLSRTTVAAATIDELAQRYRLNRVDVVKLDLEGAELRALSGASATLSKHHPLLLVETAEEALRYQGGSCAALRSFLFEFGYRFLEFDRTTGEPTPLVGEMSSDTLIAIHSGRTFGLMA
ncbi:MAG: FkbM family methyltransferase, partial [Acetobacteraceae bacterium]|nr:FkbM family methyltransferase [Acetobacteraceae bacterium]